jgi:membrane protease YdiL (CAAX protease family)
MKNASSQKEKRCSLHIAQRAVIFVCFLYIVWIGAWLLEQALERNIGYMTTGQGQFIYWLIMKILLWVVPSIILIRYSGRTFTEVMSIKRVQSLLFWGCGVGLLLGAITILVKSLGQQPVFSSDNVLSFISGVIIAPIVEEITFRGAVLGALSQQYRFVYANILTAFFFLGVHLPGWYFQGTLMNTLSSPLTGALSIFLLGLVFGYVAYRSKSVSGSIITHMLNNLFNI